MCLNNLCKIAVWKWNCQELNARPLSRESSTLIIIIIIFWPRYSIPGEWKNYAMQYKKKYKNQAGMNLTPPPYYYYYYEINTPGSIDPRG